MVGIADGTPGSGVDEDARGKVASNRGGPGSTRVGWAEAGRRRPSRPPCRRRHKGASAAMRLRASQSQLNAPAPVSGSRWAVPPRPRPPYLKARRRLAGLLPHRCSAPCLPFSPPRPARRALRRRPPRPFGLPGHRPRRPRVFGRTLNVAYSRPSSPSRGSPPGYLFCSSGGPL